MLDVEVVLEPAAFRQVVLDPDHALVEKPLDMGEIAVIRFGHMHADKPDAAAAQAHERFLVERPFGDVLRHRL